MGNFMEMNYTLYARGIPVTESKDSGKYVYGFYIPIQNKESIFGLDSNFGKIPCGFCPDYSCILTIENGEYKKYIVYPDTKGQFTGYLDYTGIPIYEGDTIGSHASAIRGKRYKVSWDPEIQMFVVIDNYGTKNRYPLKDFCDTYSGIHVV